MGIFAQDLSVEDRVKIAKAFDAAGVKGYSVDADHFKVSVIPDEKATLEEKLKYYGAIEKTTKRLVDDIQGGKGTVGFSVRKSVSVEAANSYSSEQTRSFPQRDIFKPWEKELQQAEGSRVEFGKLRDKQIELQAKGSDLNPKQKAKMAGLRKAIQPVLSGVFESRKAN